MVLHARGQGRRALGPLRLDARQQLVELAEHRREAGEDRFEDRFLRRILRPVEQIVHGVQLADEDHRRALDARDRFGRRDVAPFAQPRGCLQLGADEQQIRPHAAEAILERDAVDLADQLFLPPRDELRDDAAEQNQAGDAFARRRARAPRRSARCRRSRSTSRSRR